MNPLSRKAMLVRLSIHGWYGKKIDRRATEAAAQALHIEQGSDEYHKYLIPSGAFSGIRRVNTAIRAFHAKMALPWYDEGMRVLPGNDFMAFTRGMHDLKDKRSEEVETFIAAFDTHKEYARANRAALFKEEDYPSHDELRNMFRVQINFYPVPEADDFRVSLDPETMEKLKESIRAENARLVQNGIHELKTRFREKMARMFAMCSSPDPAPRIYESTLTSTKETVDIIGSLNHVTEDPVLSAAVAAYNSWLRDVSKEALEADVDTRTRAAAAAQEVTEILNG